MDVDRRNLMKGMLASGALLALGVPSWAFAGPLARRPGRCVLLLGGTDADAGFANGARAVSDGLQIVALHRGLLTEMDRVVTLLSQSHGARWIAVMDAAAAVVLLELARTAGARLLSIGTHVCSTSHACRLRHDWATTGPTYGVGGFLATQLRQGGNEFVIMERFLQAPPDEHPLSGWTASGFSSYRVGDASAMHVHASGLSPQDACRLLDVETTEEWVAIPRESCRCDTIAWQERTWVESVGYAVTASAIGVESVQESCAARAFVHQSCNDGRTQPAERFVSFVMDI